MMPDSSSPRHVLLLANDLNELESPDPSLSRAIDRLNEIISGTDLSSLGGARGIYGMHELCLLTEAERRTKSLVREDLKQEVMRSLQGSPRSVIKSSLMEKQF